MRRIALFMVIPALLLVLTFAVQHDGSVDAASKASAASSDTEQDKADRSAREARRAFYTAPPVIPHDVVPNKSQECAFCHEEIKDTPFGMSVKTPHPQFKNCFQCHVMANTTLGPVDTAPAGSDFAGLLEPKEGSRAHPLAPPTIPHRLFMRENCLSCHSQENPAARLSTEHPQRSQCVQCHVPSKQSEFSLGIPGKR